MSRRSLINGVCKGIFGERSSEYTSCCPHTSFLCTAEAAHTPLCDQHHTNVQTEAVLATVPCSLGGLSYDLLRSSVRSASKTQQTETEKKPETLPTMNTSMGSFLYCDEVYSCHLLCDTGADRSKISPAAIQH